jgi:hypothetical protein
MERIQPPLLALIRQFANPQMPKIFESEGMQLSTKLLSIFGIHGLESTVELDAIAGWLHGSGAHAVPGQLLIGGLQ